MPKTPAKAAAPARAPVKATAPAAPVPAWMRIANSYIGIREAPGVADNPKVVEFFMKAGHGEVKHDATPWCAAFVGAVLKDAGIKGTGTLWALDYAKWGQALKGPAIGAVATKRRTGGGHVFFVVGFDKTRIWGLGGNQDDMVCVAEFPRSSINSYRWPPGQSLPSLVASAGQGSGAAKVREA